MIGEQEDSIPELFTAICFHVTKQQDQVDLASDFLIAQEKEERIMQIKENFTECFDSKLAQKIFEETFHKKQMQIKNDKTRLKPKNSFHNITLNLSSTLYF